jgi:hypothetical protein
LSLTSKALCWTLPALFDIFVKLLRTFAQLPVSLRPLFDFAEDYEKVAKII